MVFLIFWVYLLLCEYLNLISFAEVKVQDSGDTAEVSLKEREKPAQML